MSGVPNACTAVKHVGELGSQPWTLQLLVEHFTQGIEIIACCTTALIDQTFVLTFVLLQENEIIFR